MVVVFLYVLVNAVILFLSAGTLNWPAAWLYFFGMGMGSYGIAGVIIIRQNPEIINKRGRKSDDTKPFDKTFSCISLPDIFMKNEMRRKVEANWQSPPPPFEMMLEPVEDQDEKGFCPVRCVRSIIQFGQQSDNG